MSVRSRTFIFVLPFILVVPSSLLGGLADYNWASLLNRPSASFVHLVSKNKAPASGQASASLVRNIRFHEYTDHTRVVLDLKRPVDYTPRKVEKLAQVQIQLRNTFLGKKSRNKLKQKGFPKTIEIQESKGKLITIALNMESLSKYEILTLKNPHRLVLDLYPSLTQSPPPTPRKIPPPKVKPGQGMLIVLDPGHGGKDPGALGRRGTREKDIVLKIANHVKQMIQDELGANVLLTREKDVFVGLEERAKFANTKKADLFVSIHVNSHRLGSVKGLELYHFGEASDPRALEVAARENGTPLEDDAPAWQFILADKLNDKKIEDSRDLAWTTRTALVKYLKKHYKVKDHGVKTAPFFVLRMTTMPGILAEIAFVSNPAEEKLLRSKTYQKRVAEGIFKGVKAYVNPLQTVSRSTLVTQGQ